LGKGGKTVERRRAKNPSTKLGKKLENDERDLKAKPRNEITEAED
jgi:hypothetical protein